MSIESAWGLQTTLDQQQASHHYRRRRTLDSAQGPIVQVDGKAFIAFCSNDYLGLANHPALVNTSQQALQQWGVGSGAAHLISGHQTPHEQLEQQIAAWTGRERALVFSTGFMANLGVITALMGRDDVVFQDRLNHASLIDAGLASGAKVVRYQHSDMRSLEQQLQTHQGRRRLVVSDGVFSMDGDRAPIKALVQLCEHYQAGLMIDDAHGIGVFGESGGGCLEAMKLTQSQVPILMATFGKALGVFGAFVAGSEVLIETLIQKARSYIYTTAMPAAFASTVSRSIELCQQAKHEREHLTGLTQKLRQGLLSQGFKLIDSDSPIQALILGDSEKALNVSAALYERGFLIQAIRPPTVPINSARLRITLSAAHTQEQVDALLAVMSEMRA